MPSVRHDAPRIRLGFLPVLAATVLPLVGVVWFGLDSETLVAVYALELLIPECCDPFVETSEYNGEYVSPLLWITVVRAWCGCIRWRMEMLSGWCGHRCR